MKSESSSEPETHPEASTSNFIPPFASYRKVASLKAGQDVIAPTRVKWVKTRWASAFQGGEFDILYGRGISREAISLTWRGGQHYRKDGSWFSYKNERIGRAGKTPVFFSWITGFATEFETGFEAFMAEVLPTPGCQGPAPHWPPEPWNRWKSRMNLRHG
jgi:hypothetical protein